MARRRMICPTIWEDEDFAELSDKAKILFVACFSNADDDGRLVGNPAHLRSLAFRFNEKITIETVKKLSEEIATTLPNFMLYEYNGRRFIQLLKWENHQTQRPERRKDSKLPAFNGDTMTTICQPINSVSKVKLNKDKLSKLKEMSDNIKIFFIYYNGILKTKEWIKRDYQLTYLRKRLIESRLKEGRTLDDLKQCVNNFVQDTWEDRHKYIDLKYCLGIVRGIDMCEKWLNSTTPKKKGKSWID